MKRLEEAARRLEAAVQRLEQAMKAQPAQQEAGRLTEALAAEKKERAALEETTTRVAGRLDAAIQRLSAVLGP